MDWADRLKNDPEFRDFVDTHLDEILGISDSDESCRIENQ